MNAAWASQSDCCSIGSDRFHSGPVRRISNILDRIARAIPAAINMPLDKACELYSPPHKPRARFIHVGPFTFSRRFLSMETQKEATE